MIADTAYGEELYVKTYKINIALVTAGYTDLTPYAETL